MEIEHLSIRVDEVPLNELLSRRIPKGTSVQDLKVRLEESCIALEGKYAASLFAIRFRVEFQPRIAEGKLHVEISNLKISGMPAALFRNMLMDLLKEQTEMIPGISFLDQAMIFDPEELLRHEGIFVRGRLQNVATGSGFLRLLAGS